MRNLAGNPSRHEDILRWPIVAREQDEKRESYSQRTQSGSRGNVRLDAASRAARSQKVGEDEVLYSRLHSIMLTLEWVYPSLIKTTAKGLDRRLELAEHKHYAAGPLHATLHP